MNKKTIKPIIYCTMEDVTNGHCDIGIDINGVGLVDLPHNAAFEILRANGLINGEDIIIPAGLELTGIEQFGGAVEYNFNNGFIKVDLALDDEDEYIA